MVVQDYDIDSLRYIPDWNGNKELLEGEQVVIHFSPPTMATATRLKARAGRIASGQELELLYSEVATHIKEIENLSLGTKQISTGAELMKEVRLINLVDNIAMGFLQLFLIGAQGG